MSRLAQVSTTRSRNAAHLHGVRRRVLAFIVGLGTGTVLIAVGAVVASAQVPPSSTTSVVSSTLSSATTVATSTTSTTTVPSPALINVSGTAALWFVLAIVLVLALLVILPLVFDARQAERWRDKLGISITEGTFQGPDLQTALRAIREPRGVRGLTRSLIALLIVVIAALALAVTVFAVGVDAADLRKTIITSLMTVLATVVGFYFGSRAAQSSAVIRTRPGFGGARLSFALFSFAKDADRVLSCGSLDAVRMDGSG